ncbi:MAG: hypothetical protein UDD43_04505 [Agathobacter sp.]|nr:hypothetical protein [Agathobacter sp.]
MELKSDIVLKGDTWYHVNQGMVKRIFDTQWGLFKACLSIGVLYDKQIDDDKSIDAEDGINIPRTMFNRYAGEMQFFFQAAILTSNTIDLPEKDRLYLAFSDEILDEEMEDEDFESLKKDVSAYALNFDKIAFLKKFANYGAKKLESCISSNDSEMMENIMNFLNDSYNGNTEELKSMKQISDLDDLTDFI